MQSYSLYELNEYIQRVIALNFSDAIWIRAEISQVSISKGHYYIDLVEKNEVSDQIIASLNAIIWQRKVSELKYSLKKDFDQVLQPGMEVLFKIKVNFHERFGMKAFIEDIDPSFTFGKLVIQRQKTIKTLEQLNLLEKNALLPLQPVIQKIAVISSPTAAGLEDYLNHLKSNPYDYTFSNRLYPTAVQGIHVERDLIRNLEAIQTQIDQYDCVVIIRGGGSKLDLMGFDGLEVCKAIAQFPIPVITGIGHEIDESVADMVAHTSLRTPTAVADFILNRNAFFEGSIIEMGHEISRLAVDKIHAEQDTLNYYEQFMTQQVNHLIHKGKMDVNHLENLLNIQVNHTIQQQDVLLDNYANVLQLLDPKAILQRGYSITYLDGRPVNSSKTLKKGDVLSTEFVDGVVRSVVEDDV